MNSAEILYQVSVWLLPVLLAITLHEAAHGYVAHWLGDDTAYVRGRVSLNPLRHVDPFGTVLLPGMLVLLHSPVVFGYAKPVPVAFGRLRNPKRDMMLVALAGPGANLALALIAAFLLHIARVLPAGADVWLANTLVNMIWLNLVLAVFNMLPIPPLDGGRVLVGLLPPPLDYKLARMERHGMLILLGLLFILPLVSRQLGSNINPLWAVVGPAVDMLYSFVTTIAGLG